MTAFVSNRGASSVAPIHAERIGVPVIVTASYTFGAAVAPAINDTIDVLYVPANHIIVPQLCRVYGEELDSNAAPTLTLDVGFSGAADVLWDGVALGNAGGFFDHAGANSAALMAHLTSDADRLLQALFKTANATGVVGKTIYFDIAYKAVHA